MPWPKSLHPTSPSNARTLLAQLLTSIHKHKAMVSVPLLVLNWAHDSVGLGIQTEVGCHPLAFKIEISEVATRLHHSTLQVTLNQAIVAGQQITHRAAKLKPLVAYSARVRGFLHESGSWTSYLECALFTTLARHPELNLFGSPPSLLLAKLMELRGEPRPLPSPPWPTTRAWASMTTSQSTSGPCVPSSTSQGQGGREEGV